MPFNRARGDPKSNSLPGEMTPLRDDSDPSVLSTATKAPIQSVIIMINTNRARHHPSCRRCNLVCFLDSGGGKLPPPTMPLRREKLVMLMGPTLTMGLPMELRLLLLLPVRAEEVRREEEEVE
mmetsp:Transcript_24339/g.50012  ORF Transcript_24339/g.50012 Transcript_24339/m.50012 type:complete len:123 (+) Transcript_24339:549-917(+)